MLKLLKLFAYFVFFVVLLLYVLCKNNAKIVHFFVICKKNARIILFYCNICIILLYLFCKYTAIAMQDRCNPAHCCANRYVPFVLHRKRLQVA